MQNPSSFTQRTGLYDSIEPSKLKGSLHGKVALVTGSSRGIGRHIANALAQAGALVAVTGRTEKTAESACEEISAHSTKCIPITADVLNQNDLEMLAREVRIPFPFNCPMH